MIPLSWFIGAMIFEGFVMILAFLKVTRDYEKQIKLHKRMCEEDILRNTKALFDVCCSIEEFAKNNPSFNHFSTELGKLNHNLFCVMLDIETRDLLSSRK